MVVHALVSVIDLMRVQVQNCQSNTLSSKFTLKNFVIVILCLTGASHLLFLFLFFLTSRHLRVVNYKGSLGLGEVHTFGVLLTVS